MSINRQGVSEQLIQFNFKHLFIEELGWDKPPHGDFIVEIKDDSFRLTNIAEKRGVQVFVCTSIVDTDYPDNITRRKIEIKIRKIAHEHLIIFIDNKKTIQRWLWVYRKPGQPAQYREHKFEPGHGSEALLQKLGEIEINIEDEESLRLLDVALKLKDAFDKDKVTKKFYDFFKKQQKVFREFIEGIPVEHDRHWYSAVMLNRMMFIYFIQKKGFLNDDGNYLKSKLAESKERIGSDKYYTFYRNFLRRLFHEGLDGKEPRSNELNDLLGKIPYLNGGLFDEHELEKEYPHIKITDEAFEKLFGFFDQYQWHLDDRPIAKGNEINPEVLGYIFEKFINQKEMGAYYTKEDITEYISKNTIIPFLFDKAKENCKIAFTGERNLWDLLKDDPDRYFYGAVKKGINMESPPAERAGINRVNGVSTLLIQSKTMAQIPENIAIGLETNKPDLLDRRKDWNTKAPEAFALPTEIWRETVARWQRYFEVRQKIEKGEIRSINDLITYNLNIRQFAQDVIEIWEGPELIRAFYKAITKITVLDPTVGSGAFLFAALNILEPLYEACIIRMEQFVEDLPNDAPKSKFSDFKKVLAQIDKHPSREYFIYKSIIINNLYGVDIMDEAVEICKLRLFLKLVAQIDNVNQIEPLPDIDFNIRAGNTLVGFATHEEVKNAVTRTLDFDNNLGKIEEKAEDVQALYDVFLLAQMEEDDSAPGFKKELQNKLNTLNKILNHTLAGEYGIDHKDKEKYQQWLDSHKPFHWFVEFYGILNPPSKGVDSDDKRKTGDVGGFDVIIGNPPYVEYNKVRKEYTIRDYLTESCGNLYSFILERNLSLQNKHSRCSMIVPMSGHSTDRMAPLINHYYNKAPVLHIMNLSADAHPSVLFIGVRFRLAIFIHSCTPVSSRQVYTTTYRRWYAGERDNLLYNFVFHSAKTVQINSSIPKINGTINESILQKLLHSDRLNDYNNGGELIYFHNAPVFWIRAHISVPFFLSERDGQKVSTQLRPILFRARVAADAFAGLLCSTVFYMWWISSSDCYHLNKREVFSIPIDISDNSLMANIAKNTLLLIQDMKKKSRRRVYQYSTSGRVEYDEFYLSKSKHIIDEIDKVLAMHYGFTDEELDFIINYDIKYRMGKELNN